MFAKRHEFHRFDHAATQPKRMARRDPAAPLDNLIVDSIA